MGSTGSVGSTRSAGSGQSTESSGAPNGHQQNTGHHDNKVEPDRLSSLRPPDRSRSRSNDRNSKDRQVLLDQFGSDGSGLDPGSV